MGSVKNTYQLILINNIKDIYRYCKDTIIVD